MIWVLQIDSIVEVFIYNVLQISVYSLHPLYILKSLFILALLKLSDNFNSDNGKVKPIRIYQHRGKALVGKDVVISGWGITDYRKIQSNDLLVSTLKVKRMQDGGPHAGTDEFLVLTDGTRDYGNARSGDSGGNTSTFSS